MTTAAKHNLLAGVGEAWSTVKPDAKRGGAGRGGRKAGWEEVECGEWFPIAWRVRQRCCGCGLAHVLRFRVRQGKLEMKVDP